MRKIQNDDIWAAYRGLQMQSKSNAELNSIINQHTKADTDMLFADFVICEAAQQAIAINNITTNRNLLDDNFEG
jgi:hypothetical protein